MTEESPEVQRMYRLRFDDRHRRAKAEVWNVLAGRFFQKWIRPGDTVLDLGCGYGEFLNNIHCARRIGVDLNPDSGGCLLEGSEFHQAAVSQLSFLPSSTVDAVFSSNVIEHLSGKAEVETTLREAFRVLRPGGQLILMGPNIRFLHGRYWDFWDHLVPISDRSLCECLENLGFEVAQCVPRFLPYTTCSSLPQSHWVVRLYLALPWVWRLMGRQFLVRATKP
jgi:SAM-dependent methyltransferase